MTQTAMSPLTVAPEIKHAPDTMTAAFEDFMGAFESFKETNDRRLAEIEGKLTAEAAYMGLMEAGYIVRWLPGQGLPQALRITIGTALQMDEIATALRRMAEAA